MNRFDTRTPRRTAVGILAGSLLLLAFAGSAFAQALDTPTLRVNRAGFFRIDKYRLRHRKHDVVAQRAFEPRV